MQEHLVRALRRVMLRSAADEEACWGDAARPEVIAELRRQADDLE